MSVRGRQRLCGIPTWRWVSWIGLATFAAPFAVPASTAGSEPDPDAVVADLPFKESPPQQIFVDLAPPGNSRRLPLQLDTGATTSVLTPRLARSLGVHVSATRSDPYRRATSLGRDLLFFVNTRRSDAASTAPFEYGLLGGNFLAEYVIELDFRERRVRFFDPDRFAVPERVTSPDEAVLPLELVSNRPAIRASVNGHELLFLIDTGAPMGLMLSGEFAQAAGVPSAPVAGFEMRGVLGRVESEMGMANRLDVGPFAFFEVATAVAPNGFFNIGFPSDSIVGFDLLAQFLVRIDYPRARVWLRRDPDARFAFDARDPDTFVDLEWPLPPEPPDALVARAPRAAPEPQQVWLEWGAPQPGERVVGPVGWVEVRGWAGVGDPVEHDVVIAIDISGSTAYASGADVDRDGKLGRKRRKVDSWRTFNPRRLSSDPGDTILAAELTATRRLVELLDPDRTRIGIVVFSSGARILAPLGSDRERIDQVLDDVAGGFGSGATNLAQAIERGSESLMAASESGDGERRRTLLVLSDGYPTAPGSERLAATESLRAARAATESQIRIATFGLGLGQHGDEDVYALVAGVTGGQYRPLAKPAEILHELPRIDLADVASVAIENATNQTPGRAMRVRPDGSFDGFVLLAPGENRLVVTASGDDGAIHSEERTVVFDRRPASNPDEAARFEKRLEALRSSLEARRIETELVAEIRAARQAHNQGRGDLTLTIEASEPSD